MSIVVTGGAGFIGSHLVEKLCLNERVVVIDNFSSGRRQNLSHISNRNLVIVDADISEANHRWVNHFAGAKQVFHFAALADIVPSIVSPDEYFRSNVTGTFNVLEAVRSCGVARLVYAASSSCYGIPNEYPTPETAGIDPRYPYALTKRLGEELCLHWHKVYQVHVSSIRLFNVYGRRSRTNGTYGAVFGVFLAQKLAGVPLTIVGDGSQTRDFTYVSDVCEAAIMVARHGKPGEVYNVGSGETVSVKRIAELIGATDIVNVPKRPAEPDCTFADISKIKADTGWKPKVKIEDGVRSLLDDIYFWRDAPVWDPPSIEKATKEWFKYLR
jgi:UDP-glucose 4-epimerase